MRIKRTPRKKTVLAWNDPLILEMQTRRAVGKQPVKEISYDMGLSLTIVSRYTAHLTKRKRRRIKNGKSKPV